MYMGACICLPQQNQTVYRNLFFKSELAKTETFKIVSFKHKLSSILKQTYNNSSMVIICVSLLDIDWMSEEEKEEEEEEEEEGEEEIILTINDILHYFSKL